MTAEEQDLKAIKQRLEKIEQQNRTTEASWGRNSLASWCHCGNGAGSSKPKHPKSITRRSPSPTVTDCHREPPFGGTSNTDQQLLLGAQLGSFLFELFGTLRALPVPLGKSGNAP